MGANDDPFLPLVAGDAADEFSLLTSRPVGNASPISPAASAATTGRLAGFDLQDHPLVADLASLPGEVVMARTTVALRREMIGSSCVIVFDNGDVRRPIILGVMQDQRQKTATSPAQAPLSVQADDELVEIKAEREIVLKCGDASITLTRAGKVIIKGNYIISRSTGYNKIKGAAIDIN
jgi:Domain of unknown function (DUF6484)